MLTTSYATALAFAGPGRYAELAADWLAERSAVGASAETDACSGLRRRGDLGPMCSADAPRRPHGLAALVAIF
ncbi:MAG: hypothetical protein ACFBSD_12090 [Paracoccaceae bacterium]